MDTSPYDDRLTPIVKILETLEAHHDVSSTGTSIGISKFKLEMKTLTLIMHSNLYPLTNTGFLNLGKAKFLCDLINGAQIDICAHIFKILGRIAGQSVTRTCLPFCSLIMKIMTLKGIHLLKMEWSCFIKARFPCILSKAAIFLSCLSQ